MAIKVLSGSATQSYSLANSKLAEVSDAGEQFEEASWVRPINWPDIDLVSGDNALKMSWAVFPGDGSGNGNNFFTATYQGAVTVDFGDGTTTNYATNTAINYEFNYASAALDNTNAPVTLNNTTSRVERTSHGYVNGNTLLLYNLTGTSGLSEDRTYYVVNATTNDFQVSATLGGSPITLSGAGTATLLPYKIAVVTVTPQAGQSITSIAMSAKHNLTNLISGYTSGMLEMVIALPALVSITTGSNNPGNTMRHSYLQKVHIEQGGSFTTVNLQNTGTAIEEIYINPAINFSSLTAGLAGAFGGLTNLKKITFPANTSNATNVSGIFAGCRSLRKIPLFDVSKVTNAGFMFLDCSSLVELPPFEYLADGVSFANYAANCSALSYVAPMKINRASSFSGLFSGCSRLKKVGFFNVVGATDCSSMFTSCTSLESIFTMDLSTATNTNLMFNDCRRLRSVDVRNMQNVVNASSMFTTCGSLERIPALNLASCTNMTSMFSGCTALTEAPVLLNTGSVQNMNLTFNACGRIRSFPAYNTSAVTNFTSTFASCSSLLVGPSINTSAATLMTGMFSSCGSLRSVPLYVTSSVTNMSSMFSSCRSLQTVPEFNTSIVTTFADMFNGCVALLRLPKFNTASVTSFNNAFSGCTSLYKIPLFNTSAATTIAGMFNGCSSLREIPAFDLSAVSSSTAIGTAFAELRSLSRFLATGLRFTFSITNAALSAVALNELYTNLATISAQTITITSNYGAATDDPTIATAKGWTVTG